MKTNNIFRTSIICAALFFVCVNAYGFDLGGKVVQTKLRNGLTVLLMERHLSPTVSLYIRYRVGAVDEEPGESGAAHFLEHMMFKGTTSIGTRDYKAEKNILDNIEKTGDALDRKKRKGRKADPRIIETLSARLKELETEHKKYFIPNEINRLYTQNGGLDMNANTGQDLTTYHVSLPANKIELWARIESDRLLHPVFREFYTERDVVMEERRQRVEVEPEGKLYEEFLSAAYKTHPYGRPVLGWTEDIVNLSPSALRKIFKKYKTSGNIVIAVVGDIKPQETLKLIEKYFGRIPIHREERSAIPPEPLQAEERNVEVTFDANPMIMIGFHKPAPPSRDDYVFDVLEAILTKGRTSRLYNRLVTNLQIAKSISATNGVPGIRYSNIFAISAEPRYPHTTAELQEAILQEIENLKVRPVPEEELMKAKNNIEMDYIRNLDSNSKIASILSYYQILLGDYRYFADYLTRIDKITADDIRKAAGIYLNKNNRTIAVLNKTSR